MAARMARRRYPMILIVVLVLVAIAYVAIPYARALSLIVRVAGIGGPAQTIATLLDTRVDRQPRHMVPTRQGNVPAQIYMPATVSEHAVLVMPGVIKPSSFMAAMTSSARACAPSGLRFGARRDGD